MTDHLFVDMQPDLKESILQHIDDPKQLEVLYRRDSLLFGKTFMELYPVLRDNITAQVWYERLNYRNMSAGRRARREWLFVVIATLLAGLILKIPAWFAMEQDVFYPRNISFAVFPMLAGFFAWRNRMRWAALILPMFVFMASALYINLLPSDRDRDTVLLACIHLPLLLWSVLGYVFMGDERNSFRKRIDYLRYNGDLLVMMALMAISAMIFTIITFGLFNMIGIDIERVWGEYIVIWGAPAIPILANVLVRENPTMVNRISPLIARIFTPLVFAMLVIFLGSMVVTGKNPYQDREFLLVFNALLIGVMAIIIFSVSEATKGIYDRLRLLMLLGLSVFALIDNGIALSAISFRLYEFGLTPNRLAVLGGNVLIMAHLLLVSRQLFLVVRSGHAEERVEASIAWFLPVYTLWTIVVVFVFPLLFGFE